MSAWKEIVDYTVPSNTTSVVFNNFGTITKDDFIKIHVSLNNNTSSVSSISLFLNSATNSNLYHRQSLVALSNVVAAGRESFNDIAIALENTTSSSFAFLKLSENDRANFFTNTTTSNDGQVRVQMVYSTSSGATFVGGVNTLTFSSTITNGIGAGSRIQIYKLQAEKVADITVASNTTRVDITGLNIEKDSEYLLLSEQIAAINASYLGLFVNNNTNNSNYFSQLVEGNGSTIGSGRFTDPLYLATDFPGQRALAYSHIKLSNTGAYNSQNYTTRGMGTSNVQILNFFISSTFENLTSINQLNIVTSFSARIGAGSRFELYKLY